MDFYRPTYEANAEMVTRINELLTARGMFIYSKIFMYNEAVNKFGSTNPVTLFQVREGQQRPGVHWKDDGVLFEQRVDGKYREQTEAAERAWLQAIIDFLMPDDAAPAAPVFTITTDWLGEFDEPATIEEVREVITDLDSGNDSGWRYWLDTVFGEELRVYAEPIDPDTDERPFGCQHSIEVTPELHYLVIGHRITDTTFAPTDTAVIDQEASTDDEIEAEVINLDDVIDCLNEQLIMRDYDGEIDTDPAKIRRAKDYYAAGYRLHHSERFTVFFEKYIPHNALIWRQVPFGHIATSPAYRVQYVVKV